MYSLVPLEKQDFTLITNSRDHYGCYDGSNQLLRIVHPEFQNRGGWVLLFTTGCALCQDTKSSWFAIGVVQGNLRFTRLNHPNDRTWTRKMSTHRFPKLHYVTKEGVVVNCPVDKSQNVDPDVIINFACQNYQGKFSCCSHAH